MLSEFKHDLQSFSHTKMKWYNKFYQRTCMIDIASHHVVCLEHLYFVSQLNIVDKLFYLKILNKNTLNFKFLFA